MQNITTYVLAATTLGEVRDYVNSSRQQPPVFTLGFKTQLNVRLFNEQNVNTPYPIAAFSNIVSWYCVFDTDYNQSTVPIIVADNANISVSSVTEVINGISYTFTQISIPIPGMSTEELIEAIGANEALTGIKCEIVGYDSDGEEVFGLQILNFACRNRIYYTGDPTDPEPQWLDADQVRALVAAGFVMQFSVDGVNWHDTQGATDTYMRWRSATSASATWSPPFSIVFGTDGESSYLYIGYAEDSSGTGFSLTPALTRPYVAYVVSDTEISSPTLADFTALGAVWMRFIGQDGTNGTNGLNGSSLTPQNILAVSNDTIEANKVYALDMSANTTLSASGGTAGYMNVSYLYINPGTYTLTGGTNLEIATALDASEINYCEIIFSGTAAKLFVVASWDGNAEDLLL